MKFATIAILAIAASAAQANTPVKKVIKPTCGWITKQTYRDNQCQVKNGGPRAKHMKAYAAMMDRCKKIGKTSSHKMYCDTAGFHIDVYNDQSCT